MLQCNLTKSDESTSFILNVDWVFAKFRGGKGGGGVGDKKIIMVFSLLAHGLVNVTF